MKQHIESRVGLARGVEHQVDRRIEAIEIDAEMRKPVLQSNRQHAVGALAHRLGARPLAVRAEALTAPRDGDPRLTAREREVAALVAQGLTNGEIAERLFLSNHTIKTHINRIFAKTGSRDRVAAIAYAQRHHIG